MDNIDLKNEIQELEAENKQLREVLRRIVAWMEDCDCAWIDLCADLRKALEEGK